MAQVINSLGAVPATAWRLLHDSPEFIEAFIATCSLGAIAVPINMALRAEEQCSILHNSGATLAFMESDTCHTLLTHAPEKLRSLKNCVGCSVEEPEGRPKGNAERHWKSATINDLNDC
jgi:long-subunit acyl-CoA synthetase (AMP-forming)